MNVAKLRKLLTSISLGTTSIEEGLELLKNLPFEDIGFACLDHHRHIRKGLPEVVYGPGKTKEQLVKIVSKMVSRGGPVMVTRVTMAQAEAVTSAISGVVYNEIAKVLWYLDTTERTLPETKGRVAVVTGGTADMPVAEEACLTLEIMGHPVDRIYDVGAAGIHRLLDRLKTLQKASVLIVIAGMDGALPTIIGSLTSVPIVAVPSSTGYGANFGGLAPLLTMLNSCSTGVAVVNIDNGFGAAVFAALVNAKA
ncbi:MAG: nickel pincer cofactor biosynthesis protein LarB [Dissulfurimicrobium sp.]|uniref:nickel pincer cofactor biosynthesis protein LarB n=1 Tax=Dissulfurimicrobium sp. TaxID=2022436 RepID=UPI00404B91C5